MVDLILRLTVGRGPLRHQYVRIGAASRRGHLLLQFVAERRSATGHVDGSVRGLPIRTQSRVLAYRRAPPVMPLGHPGALMRRRKCGDWIALAPRSVSFLRRLITRSRIFALGSIARSTSAPGRCGNGAGDGRDAGTRDRRRLVGRSSKRWPAPTCPSWTLRAQVPLASPVVTRAALAGAVLACTSTGAPPSRTRRLTRPAARRTSCSSSPRPRLRRSATTVTRARDAGPPSPRPRGLRLTSLLRRLAAVLWLAGHAPGRTPFGPASRLDTGRPCPAQPARGRSRRC